MIGKKLYLLLVIIALSFTFLAADEAEKKPFTWDDTMKFDDLRSPVISYYGNWVAYETKPDRGDGEAFFQEVDDTSSFKVERGSKPAIARNEKWGAAYVLPKSVELENAKSSKDKPKKGLKLLNFETSREFDYEKVKKAEFSNDSKWLVIKHHKNKSKKPELKKKPVGSQLILRHLESGTGIRIDDVKEFHLDSASKFLFYAVSSPDGKRDGVYYRDLERPFAPESTIKSKENNLFGNLEWNYSTGKLAYLQSFLRKKGEPDDAKLLVYNVGNQLTQTVIDTTNYPVGWYIPFKNDLQWTMDGRRIFFGFKPLAEKDTTDNKDVEFKEETYFDKDSILMNKDVRVWHWNDDRISPNQLKWWAKNKDRTFRSIYDFDRVNFNILADTNMTDVEISENPNYTIGYDPSPYLKEITYKGWFFDLYLINMITGKRTLIAKRLMEKAHISPDGKTVVYFKNKHWHVYKSESGKVNSLTQDIDANFYDVKNDIPAKAGSNGFAKFIKGDHDGFIVYGAYDIWQFQIFEQGVNGINITDAIGKEKQIRFRLVDTQKDQKYFADKDTLIASVFHEKEKHRELQLVELSLIGPMDLISEKGKLFNVVDVAEGTEHILYTRESFDEFPNLWVTDFEFQEEPVKVSNVNSDVDEYKWGTSEVVNWVSPKGDSLQGYIIKPDGFDENKKYPVIVFFYEQFSDLAFRFWQPKNYHLLNYPVYLKDDYVFFLPDIKYYEGNPGYDALESINSGCQYLIDRGIAHPDKIALQGHSWSGYQAAFMITQTDMYQCAVVGAPVGNMTSAYSQIRKGTGLARQFQYEKYQSRIGGNLWDSLDNYINNSPVFKAPDAQAPLLIYHGDKDEAVPFPQGVELYLAFRRLGKECILLEYDNEPHHPRKYENKLDYSIKMKEFFDHYLLGKPAPKWMRYGKPYFGE